MKKIFLIIILFVGVLIANAQQASKVHSLGTISQGQFVKFNTDLHDTIGSNDTLSYVVAINHTNDVNLVIDQRKKSVANDTTVTVKFWESIDGITYTQVLAGSSPSVYTKTIAKAAADNITYVCASDVCWFSGRYLKIMYISATKSGHKKIPYGYIKTNIK